MDKFIEVDYLASRDPQQNNSINFHTNNPPTRRSSDIIEALKHSLHSSPSAISTSSDSSTDSSSTATSTTNTSITDEATSGNLDYCSSSESDTNTSTPTRMGAIHPSPSLGSLQSYNYSVIPNYKLAQKESKSTASHHSLERMNTIEQLFTKSQEDTFKTSQLLIQSK